MARGAADFGYFPRIASTGTSSKRMTGRTMRCGVRLKLDSSFGEQTDEEWDLTRAGLSAHHVSLRRILKGKHPRCHVRNNDCDVTVAR